MAFPERSQQARSSCGQFRLQSGHEKSIALLKVSFVDGIYTGATNGRRGKPRGYDDRAVLKAMADGLVTRTFASVDEAAKAVLCEEAGANVDRLRRKFREQGWYEKGLRDYVEDEIARRALAKVNWLALITLFRRKPCPSGQG